MPQSSHGFAKVSITGTAGKSGDLYPLEANAVLDVKRHQLRFFSCDTGSGKQDRSALVCSGLLNSA
jgi:hypothetical protein